MSASHKLSQGPPFHLACGTQIGLCQRTPTFPIPSPLSLHIRNPLVCSQDSYVTRAQQNLRLVLILCQCHHNIYGAWGSVEVKALRY
jgi:hypothetical protein